MQELKEKEKDKDYTLNLAREILAKCHPDAVNVIKHWITIIQSRWDEVASWALQRFDMLQASNAQYMPMANIFAIFSCDGQFKSKNVNCVIIWNQVW